RPTEISVRKQQLAEALTKKQDHADRGVEKMSEIVSARTQLPNDRTKVHLLFTKLGEQDNVEAYLHMFEVIATREAWARPEWAKILAPFLSGEAQWAYYALPAPTNKDYDAFKAEIMARMGLSPVSAAQNLFQWAYDKYLLVRARASQL
ncbi:MAG: hypothetical protein ACRC9V_14970, partial [Aeromonas sp.]